MIIDEVAAKIKAKIARKGVEDESTTRNAPNLRNDSREFCDDGVAQPIQERSGGPLESGNTTIAVLKF
jgi:hypothetical protein